MFCKLQEDTDTLILLNSLLYSQNKIYNHEMFHFLCISMVLTVESEMRLIQLRFLRRLTFLELRCVRYASSLNVS